MEWRLVWLRARFGDQDPWPDPIRQEGSRRGRRFFGSWIGSRKQSGGGAFHARREGSFRKDRLQEQEAGVSENSLPPAPASCSCQQPAQLCINGFHSCLETIARVVTP